MIYRFLRDGSGSVVAEDKAEALTPFLNHRYPASDIPKQARELYLRNLIRVIPDVNYTPSPLVPALNPATAQRSTWASARCVASHRFMFSTSRI